MSFGNFQRSKESRFVYRCPDCQQEMMSDEALQLHRIWHALGINLLVIERHLEEIEKLMAKKE